LRPVNPDVEATIRQHIEQLAAMAVAVS